MYNQIKYPFHRNYKITNNVFFIVFRSIIIRFAINNNNDKKYIYLFGFAFNFNSFLSVNIELISLSHFEVINLINKVIIYLSFNGIIKN